MTVQDLISSMLREPGGFQKAFKSILSDELNMSLTVFSQYAGLSQSTMYKIMEENREPNLRTIRMVIKAINSLNREDKQNFVAILASSNFFEAMPKRMNIGDQEVEIKEYTISTVEDGIIMAVRAERDGALGLVCAPILAPVIEKITSIPVVTIKPFDSVIRALDEVKNII